MKNIIKIIVLLACTTGMFVACESDRVSNPTLHTPDSFVLNVPPYVSGIYDLQETNAIEFTCTQPDYGFTAATIYSVQLSVNADFADSVELATTYTSAKMDVNAQEIAIALVGLLKIDKEEDYPTEPTTVYVRMSAELTNGSGAVVSNIITLPKVKGYFALEPVVLPTTMYLIGNVTGWNDWTKATEMVPVHSAPGVFWTVQYLGQLDGKNAQIKFNSAQSWNGADFGFEKANIDAASAALAGTVDNDGNIEIGTPGWYIVVVTTTLTGRNFEYEVQFLPPNVYLQGDVNGGTWGGNTSADLFTVPDLSLGADAQFISPAFVAASGEGGVRASILLTGYDWWKTEFMVFDGKLLYRGIGGDQEPRVAGSAGQKLNINFTKKTGSIN